MTPSDPSAATGPPASIGADGSPASPLPSAPTDADASIGADGSDDAAATVGTAATDGRRARRERNREAVVDALLAFYREGVLQPSTDQIAERAGISARSLFRYFDDIDDLCRVAIGRQIAHVGSLFFLDIDPGLDLNDRAAALVAHRLDLYEAMSWVGVVARTREPFQPLIAAELRQVRSVLRAQIRRVFAAELDALGAAEADRRVAAADVLSSFEAYRLMLDDQGLDRAAIAETLTPTLTHLLTPTPTRAPTPPPERF
ncbi:MAG: TetR/AcrR family transcriptional regulator [Ilumatobacteraceae bacterium]